MEEDHCILVNSMDDDEDDDIFEDDMSENAPRPSDDNCLNIAYLSSIIAAIGKITVTNKHHKGPLYPSTP